MVKCRLGEEKQTVLLLMRKAIAYSNSPEPLQIRTVIAPEGIKGYIYIEAYKQTHVKQVYIGNIFQFSHFQNSCEVKVWSATAISYNALQW
jgi:hypothetical protein